MLRLTSADVLERSQMKKITGGYGGSGCTYYSCHCTDGGSGSWSGCYSGGGAGNSIRMYCNRSGVCSS